MIPKSLTAAAIRPIVLATLAHGEAYGYELSQRIEYISGGTIEWSAGTLYPLLHRMETEHLIASFWRPSDAGPRRKYYRLTDKGRKAADAEKNQWLSVHEVLLRLWQPTVSFG
ncbi:MAG: PadR family transcriptional regulator [Rhodothermales bacterium]